MRVYKGIGELKKAPKNSVVTIGNFDGVHVGHREIFRQVIAHAKRLGGESVVLTFRPHPRFVLRPTNAPALLNTYEEKLELLAETGLDIVVEEPFSRGFSNISPESFVKQFLVDAFSAKALYIGHDFAFGKERAGSVETIRSLVKEQGVEVHVVPAYVIDGVPVSSSLIRQHLDNGDIPFVNRALGRTFFLRGLVMRGDGRGRRIGVPTANLHVEPRKFPRNGVYATKTVWKGKSFDSVTNIGFNPTFKGEGPELPLKVETHIFDFSEDLYGSEIEVRFYAFLREERKFHGVEALLTQMREDFAAAKSSLSSV